MGLDVLAEVLGLIELGSAEVALVSLEQLLVGLFVQLQLELTLKHLQADDAGVFSRALHQCSGLSEN
jgi:hypothetical protein